MPGAMISTAGIFAPILRRGIATNLRVSIAHPASSPVVMAMGAEIVPAMHIPAGDVFTRVIAATLREIFATPLRTGIRPISTVIAGLSLRIVLRRGREQNAQ